MKHPQIQSKGRQSRDCENEPDVERGSEHVIARTGAATQSNWEATAREAQY